jgi:RHS repeat-associated protein
MTLNWDKAGHLLSNATYQGSTTSYTYDGAGTLVALSNPDYLSVNYQYDDAGRLLSRVMSSGARSVYTYDTGGWLQSLLHTDTLGATVVSQSYTRDRVGNITQINVVTGPSTGSTSYALDALNRLTAVDGPGTANDEGFSYDRVGNRLTQTRGGTTIGAAGSTTKYLVYQPATQTGAVAGYTPLYNNRLSEVRLGSPTGTIDSAFSNDNEGRLTNRTGTLAKALTWDAKGRVASVQSLPNGPVETYLYDTTNHRVGRRNGAQLGNLDYFLEGEHLESAYSSAGVLQEKYFRGSNTDELVAGYTTTFNVMKPVMFQHDAVMSVVAATNVNGGTASGFKFRAFGETETATGSQASRLKFTGREDDGLGLYYYRARYYDPSLGRFLSEDRMGFAAGVNFYAYVNNNPINGNDPSGNETQFIITHDKILGISIGSHSAVRVDNAAGKPVLFDPAGSAYAPRDRNGDPIRGSGDFFEGRHANLDAYVAAQQATGSTVNIYRFPTTAAQETQIVNRVISPDGGSPAYTGTPLFCAVSCAAAVQGIGPFQDFGSVYTPGGLEQQLINLQKTPAPGPSSLLDFGFGADSAAGGFLLYPNKPNTNSMRSVYSK